MSVQISPHGGNLRHFIRPNHGILGHQEKTEAFYRTVSLDDIDFMDCGAEELQRVAGISEGPGIP